MPRTLNWMYAWLMAVCLSVITGCGGGGPQLAEVNGRVTLDGKPVPRAKVAFVPADAGGSPSLAVTDADGRYRLAFSQDSYGALLGRHNVSITTTKISPSEMPDTGEPVDMTFVEIPKKYNAKDALTAVVKSRGNEINFELDTK